MLVKCSVVFITTSVILSSATTTTVRSQSGARPHIYVPGGRRVKPGEFPYLVLLELYFRKATVLCSGSIPSPTTVLTSAHCVANTSSIKAYAGLVSIEEAKRGNSNVQVRNVARVLKPGDLPLYDVIICYVDQSWQWTRYVAPVTLHLSTVDIPGSSELSCQVMGFGDADPFIKSGIAHVMNQLIGSYLVCHSLKPLNLPLDYFLCSNDVEEKTICRGDAGGPAVCGDEQWGMIFVEMPLPVGPEDNVRLCLPPKAANVYVNIAYFRRWIRKNIKDISSADSIQRCSMKIPLYEELLQPPLWLVLLMAVDLLFVH